MSFFMPFPEPLIPAVFNRRLNRFLVEAGLNGRRELVHLHDPGRIKEILVPGCPLLLRPASAENRKTSYTIQLACHRDVWVSLDSALPNRFLNLCLQTGAIYEFRDYALGRREIPVGKCRFDFHLITAGIDILLEVKSVTLVRDGVALFPDAPTTRGARHIQSLLQAASQGYCGTVFFLVQRPDARSFKVNEEMDPDFARIFREGFRRGLEIMAYTSILSPEGIELGRRIPVV